MTGETLHAGADSGAIRASVGVGLIWNSPFGPLRFDYSFPLMKQSYDRIQAVPLRRRHQILSARLAATNSVVE